MIVKSSAVLLVALLALSACETAAGLGRDLQKGGQNIEEAAKKAR